MAQMPDDTDLMARFAAGEADAVRAVYDRFAGPLTTVCLSMLGDRALADEAVQATLLNAWRGAASFDSSRPLAPWLYTIARRAAVDIQRREQKTAVPTDEVADLPVMSLSFEHAWEAWEVRSALEQLPAEEREVVRLTHLTGLTQQQTAEHLGVPVGTVKSRSARAHRRLAALLRHMVEVEDER